MLTLTSVRSAKCSCPPVLSSGSGQRWLFASRVSHAADALDQGTSHHRRAADALPRNSRRSGIWSARSTTGVGMPREGTSELGRPGPAMSASRDNSLNLVRLVLALLVLVSHA